MSTTHLASFPSFCLTQSSKAGPAWPCFPAQPKSYFNNLGFLSLELSMPSSYSRSKGRLPHSIAPTSHTPVCCQSYLILEPMASTCPNRPPTQLTPFTRPNDSTRIPGLYSEIPSLSPCSLPQIFLSPGTWSYIPSWARATVLYSICESPLSSSSILATES